MCTDLDRPLRRNLVGEVACVEIGLDRTDREDQVGGFDLVINLRKTDCPDINLFVSVSRYPQG
jgi:hypothetical protein